MQGSVRLVNSINPSLSAAEKCFCSTPNCYYLVFQCAPDQIVWYTDEFPSYPYPAVVSQSGKLESNNET